MYMRIVFLCFNNNNVLLSAKETWTKMGYELIHKRGEGLRELLRGRPRGNYPCILIQPIFPKFYIGI
jgi:hypothetical protein